MGCGGAYGRSRGWSDVTIRLPEMLGHAMQLWLVLESGQQARDSGADIETGTDTVPEKDNFGGILEGRGKVRTIKEGDVVNVFFNDDGQRLNHKVVHTPAFEGDLWYFQDLKDGSEWALNPMCSEFCIMDKKIVKEGEDGS